MRDERAEDERRAVLADAAEVVDPVDRDDRLGQRRLPLAGADDQVRAARDGAGTSVDRGEGLLEGGGRRERTAHRPASPCATSQTRSGVMGRLRTWPPSTLAMALATAPAVGTFGGAPTPLGPT